MSAARTVLVLGGRSDIARAVVDRLRRDGPVDAVLASRSSRAELGEDAVDFEATAYGDHAAFAETVFPGRDIDLILVAVGILGDQHADEIDAVATATVLQTNFVGPASALTALVPRLRRQRHGTIVVLSSVAAARPRRSNFIYGSSKAGLDAFARGLAEALREDGVRVVVVRPGFVKTKMTAGRSATLFSGSPVSVAEDIVSALGGNALIVWSPHTLRFVVGALRLLPAAVFRRLRV